MPLSDVKRIQRRAKERERDSGKWLLLHDGPDPHWQHVSSSTGRIGHITGLMFDTVSLHYACEVKNVKIPTKLLAAWNQINEIAVKHGKDALLTIYPSNPLLKLGVPKRVEAMHIITEARHAELLRKERIADANSSERTP